MLSKNPLLLKDCGFVIDGTAQTQLKLTNPGIITTILITGGEKCQVRLFLVGGGGRGSGRGGGGSGFILYRTIYLMPQTTLLAYVGDKGEVSKVITDGSATVRAEPGKESFVSSGGWHNGGDGWSGGGDGCCNRYKGGSNGEDGLGDGHEGKGTGQKLTSFPMSNFFLSPGNGGIIEKTTSDEGGGGGGVLVDGLGPDRVLGQGEGYGGGGSSGDGLQGIILMEIIEQS